MRADEIIPDADLYEFAIRMVCPCCGGGHYTIALPFTDRPLIERRCLFCQSRVSKPNPWHGMVNGKRGG